MCHTHVYKLYYLRTKESPRFWLRTSIKNKIALPPRHASNKLIRTFLLNKCILKETLIKIESWNERI